MIELVNPQEQMKCGHKPVFSSAQPTRPICEPAVPAGQF